MSKQVNSENSHWLDIWLPRISNFSQFGLFAITLWSLYFTVLPLYQKAVLEEAIAKKEVELAETQKILDQNYTKLRGFAIKEFVFSTGAECSGLLIPPPTPSFYGKPEEKEPSAAEKILALDSSACLRAAFNQSTLFKQLRPEDFALISTKISSIEATLNTLRNTAQGDYNSLPTLARKNPAVLKPIGPYSARMLAFLAQTSSASQVDSAKFDMGVRETQFAIAADYGIKVREQISSLRTIEWPKSKATQ